MFGKAVTPAVAAFLAQSQDAQMSLNESVGAMQEGQLDSNKQLDINKKYGDNKKVTFFVFSLIFN